jgi:hypothetical protein
MNRSSIISSKLVVFSTSTGNLWYINSYAGVRKNKAKQSATLRETLEKPGRLSENRGIYQGQDLGDGR